MGKLFVCGAYIRVKFCKKNEKKNWKKGKQNKIVQYIDTHKIVYKINHKHDYCYFTECNRAACKR